MFREISVWHLALILIAFVLLFGYKRLPDATRSLGRSLRIFKSEVKGLHDDEPKQVETAQTPTAQAPTAQTPTAQTPTVETPAAQTPAAQPAVTTQPAAAAPESAAKSVESERS